MDTIFGYVLMFATAYALWDTVKGWKKVLSGAWKRTIAQATTEQESQTGAKKLWGCITAPFVLFREYAYALLFIPGLAVYGFMHDNRVLAGGTLAISLISAIYGFWLFKRTFNYTLAYAEERKQITNNGSSKVLLLEGGKVVKSVGDISIIPGGFLSYLASILASTICNAYVGYLFYIVVFTSK